MYKVFTRNWWKENPAWPGGLEPDATARWHTIHTRIKTEEEARRLCHLWNSTHNPGRLSRKAEYTET